jgi:pimeloyl-ACP methyl ester carboxylesterase
MAVFHPFSPVGVSWQVVSGTTMVVITGRTVNPDPTPDLTPVVFCHPFPGTSTPAQIVDSYLSLGLYSLTATGRVVVVPACGANWGHPTTSYPSGGSGLGAIDDALDVAVSMGLPDRAHLVGISMGGLNALRWAESNPSNFGAARLFVPVVDMLSMYDQASYQTSLAQVWSTGGRSAFSTATADMDPVRNPTDYSAIADRIEIFGARDDNVIDWSSLSTFCTASGISLEPSAPDGQPGGGHLAWALTEAYDEYDILRLFDANE